MRTIFRWAVMLIVLIVGYNYFFGDSHEKSESQEIIGKVKDLGESLFGFVVNEKERMEQGKYEGLFDKVENLFDLIKSQTESVDTVDRDELTKLESDKKHLEIELKEAEKNGLSPEEQDQLDRKIQDLLIQTEILWDRNKDK